MKGSIRTYSSNEYLVSERREHIARSVAPLLVKKGYGRTSIREIAIACGMSMGHLYYYIGGKEDVLEIMMDYDLHLYADFIKQIVTSFEALSPTDALIKTIDGFFRATDAASDFTLFFYQETKNLQPDARKIIMDRERGLISEFERLLHRGCQAGEFKIDNIQLVANNIVITGHMWALRRWMLGKICTLDEYIRNQTGYILKTISANHEK
jgi:TetR/AcrR family transcriptional regulator, cholesterol catabolism regulator